MEFKFLARRIQPPEGLIRDDWEQHPNGGGWVEKTASVARSAYVGPEAIVMDEALVMDQAKIRGTAIIGGAAMISGKAVVEGDSRVHSMAIIGGSARVRDARVEGFSVLADGDKVLKGRMNPNDRESQKKWTQTEKLLMKRVKRQTDQAARSEK